MGGREKRRGTGKEGKGGERMFKGRERMKVTPIKCWTNLWAFS